MTWIDAMLDRLRTARHAVLTEVHADGPLAVDGPALCGRIAGLRGGLRAHGLSPGDRVGLVGPNRIAWIATDLAILAEGLVPVPLYARAQAAELVTSLHDARAALVVVDDEARATTLRQAGCTAPIVTWGALMQEGRPIADPPAPRAPGDLATLCVTSGTSGQPKAARITIANIAAMLPVTASALSGLTHQPPEADRAFHYLPLCFMGSRIVLWTALWRGTPLWLSTDLDRLLDEIGEARPTWFLNVPALLERVRHGAEAAMRARGPVVSALYDAALDAAYARTAGEPLGRRQRAALAVGDRLLFAPIRARLGPHLRFLICGSAPLAPDVQRWFSAVGIPVYQVYGLTETTAIVTMDRPGDALPGGLGFPIPGCDVRIASDGTLEVRGAHVFDGYDGLPDATAAMFTDDGWLRTGDLASLRRGGRLEVSGRAKHVLVPTTGHNVVPEPLEQAVLAALPGASHAVIVGHGKPHLAVLVFGAVDPAAIRPALDAVNRDLPHYRRLRAHHHRAAPLTDAEGLLTANGKLRRRAITEAFAADIEALYA